MARIKKAKNGDPVKPTADSSSIYTKRMLSNMSMADRSSGELKEIFRKRYNQDARDLERQSKKGKPGYDKNGFPIKKQRNGGKTPAWQRKEGKNPSGGLNAKGVASYRKANPGSKLKMAVTTPPSKLKKGSKAANRRKSFCARMSGVKGPMRKPNGKPTRKALALRKWNC
jgi:hypothetical protein